MASQQNGESNTPSKPRRSAKSRILLALLIVLIVVIVPTAALLAWEYSTCPPVTIVHGGTVLSVPPGRHLDYNFALNKVIWGPDRPIEGAFTADNKVIMYVMTANQFAAYNQSGIASSYVWSSGEVTSATFGCPGRSGCPPNEPGAPLGSNYFTIYNPSATVDSKVTVTQEILAGC